MARKGLSPEDLQLWAAYGRTLSKLMPGRTRLKLPEAEPVKPAEPVAPAVTMPRIMLKQAPREVAVNATPAGLDKSTWAKFKGQKIRVEARLDLHGHNAARAHQEVRQFMSLAIAAKLRCVEIITGNGEILARELPLWLNGPELRPMILGLAHPHARNSGSVRVLLRRGRGG